MSRNMILDEIQHDDIQHDPWGTALAWHFAVAAVLDAVGDVPGAWQYRPSPLAVDDVAEIASGEEEPDALIATWWMSGDVTTEALVYAGNVLARYVRVCERAGKSY